MPFDKIAVIAIHGANEAGQGGADTCGQAAAKRRCLGGEFDRQILDRSEARRPLADFHRLHQVDGFAAIFNHLMSASKSDLRLTCMAVNKPYTRDYWRMKVLFNVRFNVRFLLPICCGEN